MTIMERGVLEVIAQNSRYEVDEIVLAASLDVYISSSIAGRFARELVRKFRAVDGQILVHQLFITLKTVKSVVDHIATYYPTQTQDQLVADWKI